MNPPLRCATYLRVSTDVQTLEPQRIELNEAIRKRGLRHVLEFTDVVSGGKVTREGLDAMIEDMKAGAFDVVMVVKLDRLGRSLQHVARLIEEFQKHEIALVIPGQGIDTSKTNPAGILQMHVLAAVAQFERSIISERTKAGLVAARARGSVLGKPSTKLVAEWRPVVRGWRVETGGVDFKLLAERLGGVSKSTAHRLMRRLEIEDGVTAV